MHMAHGDQSLDHIRLFQRIGLGRNALIAITGRTRLIRIDAGNHQDLILDLLLHRNQAGDIVNDRILPIRRAGADDQQQPMILTGENICDLLIPPRLGCRPLLGERNGLLHLFGRGKLAEKFHIL